MVKQHRSGDADPKQLHGEVKVGRECCVGKSEHPSPTLGVDRAPSSLGEAEVQRGLCRGEGGAAPQVLEREGSWSQCPPKTG